MPVLTDPEEDQRSQEQTGQPDGADRDSALDQQGAKPLSADESSRFEQLTAGLQAAGSFVGANKKKFLLGGGGVGIVAFLIIGFIALLPLKLEAMVKNVLQRRVTDKVEYMMEKRADKLVTRFLGEKFAGNGAVVTDASIVKSMYGNWAKNKFEAKFSENSGIKIEKADGGGIKLTSADGITATYPNEEKFLKFLDGGTLKGIDARNFIRTVTRNETKWYQVVKRRNLRQFMRNAYGIHKWSWFTGKKGADAEAEVRDNLIDNAMGPVEEDTPRVINCALDGHDCPTDNSNPDKPYGSQEIDAPKSATGGDGDASLGDDTGSAIRDAVDKVKQYSPSKLFEKGLSNVLSKVIGEELGSKLASKAAPIIGQILLVDQAARIDHFFTSGKADESLRSIHKVEYATEFAQFATIADNFKDPNKQMSGDEFNAVMNRVGDISRTSSGQPSAAFEDLFMNKSGGESISANMGVNDTAEPIKADYNQFANTIGAPITVTLRTWYTVVDGTFIHKLIDALNSVLRILFNQLMSVLENLVPGIKSVMGSIGDLMSKLMLKLVPVAVDGTETAGNLFNAIDAGGAVTGQDFSRSLGGHALSASQSAQLQEDVVAYNTEVAPSGLLQRLTSTDYAYSSVNQLAAVMPPTAGAAAGQAGHYMAAMVQSPISWFVGLFNGWFAHKVDAASGRNLYGLTDYGFTDAELSQPIDDAGLNQAAQKAAARLGESPDQVTPDQIDPSDCPDAAPGQGNLCRLDLATIQSMNSAFTTNDDGGLGDGGTTSAGTTPPSGNLSNSQLYSDSSSMACPSGTKDLGVTTGYAQGQPTKIKLCALSNLASSSSESTPGNPYYIPGANGKAVVNAVVATAWSALVAAAQAAGASISADSAFRSYAHQQSLCPCDGVNVAQPGYSNHGMGLAIDFNIQKCPSTSGSGVCQDPSSPVWTWLNQHAAQYGMKQYANEAWHWSPTGN